MYPFCNNAREFVKRFHDEGRHEYDAECGVERLEKRIDVVMDPNNPAVAGKYFIEDYVFTRSGIPILENNLKMVQDIKTSIQKQVQKNIFVLISPKQGNYFQGTTIQKHLMKTWQTYKS